MKKPLSKNNRSPVFKNFNKSNIHVEIDASKTTWLSDTGLLNNITLAGGDFRKLLKINSANPNDSVSYVHIFMEFEVVQTAGSDHINLATAAYSLNKDPDISDADKIANAKSNFHNGIKSTYETLETVKGMASNSSLLATDVMNFDIYEPNYQNKYLPFWVQNQLYPLGSANGIFTTNMTPLSENNQYSVPQSSVLITKYDGDGVIRSSNSERDDKITQILPERSWTFDTYHSRMAEQVYLPPELKFGTYANKTTFYPNELLSSRWLEELAQRNESGRNKALNILNGLDRNSLDAKQGFTMINCGYGVTYEVNARIFNNSNKRQYIDYLLNGGAKDVAWRAAVSSGDKSWNQAWQEAAAANNIQTRELQFREAGTNRIFQDNAGNIYPRVIDPGQCLNLQVWVTIQTGSAGTIHHAIVVNATDGINLDFQEQTLYYQQ